MKLRAAIYVQLQRLIGSRVDLAYRDIRRLASLSAEKYRAEMARKLRDTLTDARATIPFYQSVPGTFDDLRLDAFPMVTKDILIEHYRDLMSPQLRREYDGNKRRGYGWVEVRSGGTTGVPVAVVHGSDFRDHDRATRMFQQDMCGFPFGTPYIRLWGSMKDINQMKDSRAHRIMIALANETLLNAFQMEPENLDRYLDIIRKRDVPYMMAYIDAAAHLARHAIKKGVRPRLSSVMACAGTVTEDARSVIREAFGARVHNKYGTRDAGEIACECDQGGLHILPGVVVEAVDDAGRACAPGQSGRLLITCMHNRDFPLIRYEIGDVGALSDTSCKCGLPFPCFDRLEGRAMEFLQSTSGGYISPVYIRHLIGVVHPPVGLRRYQMEQTGPNVFVLRLEREPGAPALSDDATGPLRRDLSAVLGDGAELSIQDVDRIPESASGKFQYVINRYPKSR